MTSESEGFFISGNAQNVNIHINTISPKINIMVVPKSIVILKSKMPQSSRIPNIHIIHAINTDIVKSETHNIIIV